MAGHARWRRIEADDERVLPAGMLGPADDMLQSLSLVSPLRYIMMTINNQPKNNNNKGGGGGGSWRRWGARRRASTQRRRRLVGFRF